MTVTVTGNSLSAGANIITAISIPLLSRRGDVTGTVRTLKASILGVTGLLTSTQYASAVANSIAYTGGTDWFIYTFTPDAGQTLPVSVAAGSAIIINPEARQDSILLCWLGRNNVGTAGWQAECKTRIAAIVAAFKPLVKKIVVIGMTNTTAEYATAGGANATNYSDIVQYNLDLAALYPDYFVDVRPAYNAGTSNDVPAAANTTDGLHYTEVGRIVVAGPVSTFITSKGWLA